MPRVIPFGDTILVKRRKVGTTLINGKTLGGLHIPESAEGRNTDLADVTYVPDITFSDKEILDNSESIVKALTKKATNGNVDALNALLELNTYIKRKSIKVNDAVMISKYVGTDFTDTNDKEGQTMVSISDVIGLVVE